MSAKEWVEVKTMKSVVKEFKEYAKIDAIVDCIKFIIDLDEDHKLKQYINGKDTYNKRVQLIRQLLRDKGYSVPFRSGHYIIKEELQDEGR